MFLLMKILLEKPKLKINIKILKYKGNMKMTQTDKKGIAVAGTILLDKINEISAYPQCGELTKIQNVSFAVGGCVPNVAIDLKKISPETEIFALGKIGNDSEGEFIIENLVKNGVDVSGISVDETEKTSFTDVMSVVGGQRTFFTYLGADSQFAACDVDFKKTTPQILHLGYFLLLDKIDNGEGLKMLKKAKEAGIKTSIDLVSENSDRYNLVVPCLPYVDYLIINETEAGKLAGMETTDENLELIANKLRELGVREKVIIHMPEKTVCLSSNGYICVNSCELPKGYIKGTTGAGDAFCAGALIGIYKDFSDEEILKFGEACAIMALSTADATSGLKCETEVKENYARFIR